ncbi:MAG TPA: beta-galactosidase, partial [bacterium]|nr:beta-galactosidase [bacterium]
MIGGTVVKRLLYLAICLLSSVLLAADCAHADSTFFHQDDFRSYPKDSDGSPAWETLGISWTAGNGRFECVDPGKDFALLSGSPWGELGHFEVTLVLKESISSDWGVAGLGFCVDRDHYWHYAFVEQPDEKGKGRFVELAQMFAGQWNAQASGATELKAAEIIGQDFRWSYNTPYRMRIEWNSNSVRGTILDMKGVLLSRISYRFGFQPGCRVGKPMLVSGGFRSHFSDVQARISGREDYAMAQPTPFPEYTVKGNRRVQGERTGYFHVKKEDGRWWLFDPKGNGFFMVGTDHCNYRVHWCEKLGYAPYHEFVSEKYPSEEAWADNAVKRLLKWNFNSLGANNSPSTRYKGLAYTEFLGVGQGFVNHDDICPRTTWTGFPNVFNPRFREFCRKQASQRCAPLMTDPWLLGYFIDNELEWFGKSHKPWGLCDEVFKKPSDHTAKRAFAGFVQERHKDIESFNKAWGTTLTSFDAILDVTSPIDTMTELGLQDKKDFVRLIAEKYFEITTTSIREYDPNHLILGTRFAGQNPSIWDIAGKYCDVVSVNCYRTLDLETEEFTDGFPEDLLQWYEQCKKPLMITEWSYPALDAGLPCKYGAGQRVDTQAQRAKAYSIFQRKVFSLPFMVGSMFFMWVDEPALGIASTFPEDSNYGLVNERDEEYPELTQTATRINKAVYDLHEGRTSQLRAEFKSAGVLEVGNHGRADARTSVVIWMNGNRTKRTLRVKSGQSQTVNLALPKNLGGVFTQAVIDPTRLLIEPDAVGHRAQLIEYNSG